METFCCPEIPQDKKEALLETINKEISNLENMALSEKCLQYNSLLDESARLEEQAYNLRYNLEQQIS